MIAGLEIAAVRQVALSCYALSGRHLTEREVCMPQQKIENLISQLHDLYGTDETSPEQQRLLADLERHVHTRGTADRPDPVPLETLETLVEEMAVEHPRTATVMRQLMETLKNIGV